MGGVTAWNLGKGFTAYLQARDEERLNQFALVVSDYLQDGGSTQALQQDSAVMPTLLRELARREGAYYPGGPPRTPPGPRRPPPAEHGDGRADHRFGDDGGRPQYGRPHGPPHGPKNGPAARGPPPGEWFGDRVAIYDADGLHIGGPLLRAYGGPPIERAVSLNGETVALVRMRLAGQVPNEIDAQFLRTQYLSIAAAAIALMLLALAAAWWLARQWARPLAAVRDATARIAQGELGVRLQQTRNDEIGDVVRNVNQMAESLQRIEGARRRWIADMSHELRTPLSVLRGEIEALVDGVRPLNQRAVESLREEVLRLGTLIDDLHLLSMADLKSLPCRLVRCDATQIVRQTMQRFEARAATAGLVLAWAAPPPDPLTVYWDPARIDQLLANLLENSLRYTESPGRIEISLRQHGDTVQLSVADSTPGVFSGDLSRLFEPLYRADAARGRHDGGSGLGLAICRAIVHSHGGTINALTSPLGGLTIIIDLPRQAEGPSHE
jgi:two-component system, OmpR family, sensor histidine kinase BaeS